MRDCDDKLRCAKVSDAGGISSEVCPDNHGSLQAEGFNIASEYLSRGKRGTLNGGCAQYAFFLGGRDFRIRVSIHL